MESERRIEKLEQEVEILKHQIQETLLEIQEKMLNNTYPSLRSGVQPPQDTVPVEEINPNERPTQLHRPQYQPQQKQEEHQAPPSPPQPKKNQKVVSIADYTGTPAKSAPAPQTPEIDWEELDRMEAWVLHKLKTMGITKTRKLIRLHMSKERMSQEMGSVLLQFVALYDKQQREPAPTETGKEASGKEEPGEQNLILRLIAGVGSAGMGRAKGQKHG